VRVFWGGLELLNNYDNCSLALTELSLSKETKIVIRYRRKGKLHTGDEKNRVIFEKHLESKILKALFSNSPLWGSGYRFIKCRTTSNIGLGMIGCDSQEWFFTFCKDKMNAGYSTFSLLQKK
jgi:hypothetical protein